VWALSTFGRSAMAVAVETTRTCRYSLIRLAQLQCWPIALNLGLVDAVSARPISCPEAAFLHNTLASNAGPGEICNVSEMRCRVPPAVMFPRLLLLRLTTVPTMMSPKQHYGIAGQPGCALPSIQTCSCIVELADIFAALRYAGVLEMDDSAGRKRIESRKTASVWVSVVLPKHKRSKHHHVGQHHLFRS
jgi:hypothetical protein